MSETPDRGAAVAHEIVAQDRAGALRYEPVKGDIERAVIASFLVSEGQTGVSALRCADGILQALANAGLGVASLPAATPVQPCSPTRKATG